MSYKIKSRIWIEVDGSKLLGQGNVKLLKAIEKTESLSKAAKLIGMSYKKAWLLVNAVNKRAKKPVTINSIGGKGGGGSKLTPYGKSLIASFDEINKNCWTFLNKQLAQTSI